MAMNHCTWREPATRWSGDQLLLRLPADDWQDWSTSFVSLPLFSRQRQQQQQAAYSYELHCYRHQISRAQSVDDPRQNPAPNNQAPPVLPAPNDHQQQERETSIKSAINNSNNKEEQHK
jgi:hypothetical protein